MQRVAVAMRECRVPIITQVHRYAIGGGAEISLSGDIVIQPGPGQAGRSLRWRIWQRSV